jgi:hypothetical protein
MTEDTVEDALIPIAAELIGVVRDYGPADVAAVLARVPDGRHDALAVVLAAMVDPDARPSELLEWTKHPVQSRDTGPEPNKGKKKGGKSRRLPREHGTERGYQQHRSRFDLPACTRCITAHTKFDRDRKKVYRDARKAAGLAS